MVAVEDLERAPKECVSPGEGLIFPDGRTMEIPEEGVQVIVSAATVDGSEPVPDLVILNDPKGGVAAAAVSSDLHGEGPIESWGSAQAQEKIEVDLATYTGNQGEAYTLCNDGFWSQLGSPNARISQPTFLEWHAVGYRTRQ